MAERPTFLEQWAELGRAVGEVRDAVLADPAERATWLVERRDAHAWAEEIEEILT